MNEGNVSLNFLFNNKTFRIPFFSNLSEIILEHARQYQRFVDQKLLLY